MQWPNPDTIVLELIKALFTVLTVAAGAFLTARYWSTWQKRRELQLAAADAFYILYGEFFEISKLWEFVKDPKQVVNSPEEMNQWVLLRRASAAEGKVEAIFVRLVSQRRLS